MLRSSLHLNKSHFMRISSKLQQLNVDTRDEIYHQKLLFCFFNKLPVIWYWARRESLLAVIDKNEGLVKVQSGQIGKSWRADNWTFYSPELLLLNVGAIIENPSQWLCLKLLFGELLQQPILLHVDCQTLQTLFLCYPTPRNALSVRSSLHPQGFLPHYWWLSWPEYVLKFTRSNESYAIFFFNSIESIKFL